MDQAVVVTCSMVVMVSRMIHYIGLVLALSLSCIELSSTGLEHDLNGHVWNSVEDTVGTYST
jgi:hypothetical protein